ncbi:MAG: hypothetical protein JWN62_3577 [Acidimicrobiales bacterium]|nr:hypothetical protein [Acidimicrobiales bacterium]
MLWLHAGRGAADVQEECPNASTVKPCGVVAGPLGQAGAHAQETQWMLAGNAVKRSIPIG